MLNMAFGDIAFTATRLHQQDPLLGGVELQKEINQLLQKHGWQLRSSFTYLDDGAPELPR